MNSDNAQVILLNSGFILNKRFKLRDVVHDVSIDNKTIGDSSAKVHSRALSLINDSKDKLSYMPMVDTAYIEYIRQADGSVTLELMDELIFIYNLGFDVGFYDWAVLQSAYKYSGDTTRREFIKDVIDMITTNKNVDLFKYTRAFNYGNFTYDSLSPNTDAKRAEYLSYVGVDRIKRYTKTDVVQNLLSVESNLGTSEKLKPLMMILLIVFGSLT